MSEKSEKKKTVIVTSQTKTRQRKAANQRLFGVFAGRIIEKIIKIFF